MGLYNSIPHDEGLGSLQEGLYEQNRIGCAMGTKPAPSYADICMAIRIDNMITSLAHKYARNNRSPLTILERFLDNIFSIFQGTSKKLHKLFDEMNQLHTSIKFTMNHTS